MRKCVFEVANVLYEMVTKMLAWEKEFKLKWQACVDSHL